MLDMITLALLRILLPDLEFSLLFGGFFALLCLYAIKWHGTVSPVPFCLFSVGTAVTLSNLFVRTRDNFFWIGIVAFAGFCFATLPQTFTTELREVIHSLVYDIKHFCTKTVRENRKLKRENEALRRQILKSLPEYKVSLGVARRIQELENERDEARAEIARLNRKQENAKVSNDTALNTALNSARHQSYTLQTKLNEAKTAASAASDTKDSLQQELQDVKVLYNQERCEKHVLSQKAGQFHSIIDFLINSSEGSDIILRKAAIIVAYHLVRNGMDLYAANIDHRKVENLFTWVSVGDDCAIRPDGGFRLEDRVYPLTGLQVVGTTIINTRQQVQQNNTSFAAPAPAPILSSASVPPIQAPQSAPSGVQSSFVAPPAAPMPVQQVPVAAASLLAVPAPPVVSSTPVVVFGAGNAGTSASVPAPAVSSAPAASSAPAVVFVAGSAAPSTSTTKTFGAGMARKATASGPAGRNPTGRRRRH